jgi:hypothetical protein
MQLTSTPKAHPSPTPTSSTSMDFGFFVPPLLHIFMLLLLAGSFQMNKIKHVEFVWGFVLFCFACVTFEVRLRAFYQWTLL